MKRERNKRDMREKIKKLPEGWKKVKLGDVCQVLKDISPVGSYPYLEISDIDTKTKRYDIKEKVSPSHCFKARKNNIVISKVRPTRGAVSKIKEDVLYVSPALLVIDAKNSSFLFYVLCREKFFIYLGSLEEGTTYPSVNDNDILNFEFYLPESDTEQEKIAEILQTIDNAIEKTDKIIEKYERIKKGLMQDLLTKGIDENWQIRSEKTHKFKESPLGKIPEEWEVVKLGEVAKITMGQSPPSSAYNNEGIGLPFLQGKAEFGEIYPNPIKYCTKPLKLAQEGDILISVRAPVGDVNIAQSRYAIGRGLAAIKPINVEKWLLFYFLVFAKNRIEEEGTGSTFKAIRKSNLETFKIPFPPLPEQERIVKVLSQIDEVVEKEKAFKRKLERIKKGLMEDLLTGKVRVNKLIGEQYENK